MVNNNHHHYQYDRRIQIHGSHNWREKNIISTNTHTHIDLTKMNLGPRPVPLFITIHYYKSS